MRTCAGSGGAERHGESGAVALEYIVIAAMLLATVMLSTLVIMRALGHLYLYMITVVSSPLL